MKLPKAYIPGNYETDIYDLWEQSGAFKPSAAKDHFSIVAPPPNANAPLHIGYGLTIAVEDIAVRYQRLKGKSTLFVPGADHAGFETQAVYEKHLAKEGKSRFDFSREELYKQMWDFVAQNRSNFEKQFRSLGASVDWEHFTFTLDDKIVNRAYKTFQKMWDEGLIYRGERIVNYCTYHGTSFADYEVVYEEEKEKLYYTAYQFADGSGEVVVASARPETKVGQAALMVSPNDERYKQFIGKVVNQPLVPDAPIKIIADDYVNPDFGTGVVTVTPGHDPNDFEVARRHDLPILELINTNGKMSDNVPEQFRGLTVKEARVVVTEALDKAGALRKVEDYTHSVGKCYKCGTVIEPLLKDQWFVNMEPLAKPAIEALKKDEIKFYPETKKQQLISYLEGLRDWNISRQIAWGIPIPAFQNVNNPRDWIFNDNVTEEIIEEGGQTYRRDPDVFDTWFSSSSWPYATLNYPDADFKKFYPLSLMETGGEILYPWVSRMLMLGLYVTGKVPFTAVYIHGYVMAEDGSKMSKSKGNTVDLGEVLEKYGSDALRMGIVAGRVPAVNRGYDARRVEEARNFCNKLWNIARFIEDKAGEVAAEAKPETPADHWILTKLADGQASISKHLDDYRFAEGYEELYHLVWDDVADWYLETAKVHPNPGMMKFVLETVLKLMHPFAPFVTETIWQTLHAEDDSLLINQEWPEVGTKIDKTAAAEFEQIKAIISEIRFITSALQTSQPSLYYRGAPFLGDNSELIMKLARLARVQEVEAGRGMHLTQTSLDAWLDIDLESARSYLRKLDSQKDDKDQSIARLEARLANTSYVKNAPKEVVSQTRAQLKAEKLLLDKIKAEIATFQNLAA